MLPVLLGAAAVVSYLYYQRNKASPSDGVPKKPKPSSIEETLAVITPSAISSPAAVSPTTDIKSGKHPPTIRAGSSPLVPAEVSQPKGTKALPPATAIIESSAQVTTLAALTFKAAPVELSQATVQAIVAEASVAAVELPTPIAQAVLQTTPSETTPPTPVASVKSYPSLPIGSSAAEQSQQKVTPKEKNNEVKQDSPSSDVTSKLLENSIIEKPSSDVITAKAPAENQNGSTDESTKPSADVITAKSISPDDLDVSKPSSDVVTARTPLTEEAESVTKLSANVVKLPVSNGTQEQKSEPIITPPSPSDAKVNGPSTSSAVSAVKPDPATATAQEEKKKKKEKSKKEKKSKSSNKSNGEQKSNGGEKKKSGREKKSKKDIK